MSVAADQLTLGAALLVVVPVAFAANAAAASAREVGEDLGVLAQDVVHAAARADPLLRLLLWLRLERLVRGSGVRLFAARGRLWWFRVLVDPPLGALPPEAGVERASRILKRSFQINLHVTGHGGLVVSILALYSDDTSLNPTGY